MMRILFSQLKASIGNASKLLGHNRALITNSSEVSQVLCYNRASFSNGSHVIHQTGVSIANSSSEVSQDLGHNRAASFGNSSQLPQALYYNQNESYFVQLFKHKIMDAESKTVRYTIRPDRIHATLVKNGMKSDQIMCRQLRLYASCGRLKEAKNFFYECYFSNVAGLGVWNAAIIGLGLHGEGLEAIQIFNNIPKSLVPTQNTYWNVMVACAHSGEVEFAHYILGKIYKKLFIEPKIEHVGTYIDGLARKGNLTDAYREVQAMIYEPSYEIIVCILSRCQNDKMENTALANDFVKFLKQKGVSYRVIKPIYRKLESDGVNWGDYVKILRQRQIGTSKI